MITDAKKCVKHVFFFHVVGLSNLDKPLNEKGILMASSLVFQQLSYITPCFLRDPGLGSPNVKWLGCINNHHLSI